jgi:hypothetical protein
LPAHQLAAPSKTRAPPPSQIEAGFVPARRLPGAASSLPRDPAMAAHLRPLGSALRSLAPLLKTKVHFVNFGVFKRRRGLVGGGVVEGRPNPVGKSSGRVAGI